MHRLSGLYDVVTDAVRSEDNRRCVDGGGASSAGRHDTHRVRTLHLRAGRSPDLPGNAQEQVHVFRSTRERSRTSASLTQIYQGCLLYTSDAADE